MEATTPLRTKASSQSSEDCLTGYRLASLTRACGEVNCQWMVQPAALRSASKAATRAAIGGVERGAASGQPIVVLHKERTANPKLLPVNSIGDYHGTLQWRDDRMCPERT